MRTVGPDGHAIVTTTDALQVDLGIGAFPGYLLTMAIRVWLKTYV